ANATAYILREFSRIPDLEVDLVTSATGEKYELEKIGENIKIHKLPIGKNEKNLHFQSQKDLLVYAWKAYFYSKKLIKENSSSHQCKRNNGSGEFTQEHFGNSRHWCGGKYDLTHSFFTVPCGFVSLLLKRKYKLPYIVSLRGSDVPGYSERFSFLYNLLTPLIRHIWKKSVAVVSNSKGLKELALKTNAEQPMDIIYNGIDVEHFSPKTEARPEGKFIITSGASRVTGRKGLRYLIEAVSSLAKRYPQIYLKIMGDGDDKKNLEILAEELKIEKRVEFLGRIPRENTAPYYQEANVFVLSSLNEGMSNAMLEALASGLPLIATDTGGSQELIKDGENGFIVKMKDSTDIAEKLEKLIVNPELVRSMGEKSRERALEMSWSSVAKSYYELYESTVNNK
ncbi:MAG: glycosyltransferase, partial [Patescibacteria group bacterium]